MFTVRHTDTDICMACGQNIFPAIGPHSPGKECVACLLLVLVVCDILAYQLTNLSGSAGFNRKWLSNNFIEFYSPPD